MAILRTNKRDNFTILPNSTLQNVELSWEARGLLAYLLSLPANWQIHMSELVARSPSGKDKLARIVKELCEKGYILKTHLRGERGRFADWVYDVFDEPQVATVGGQTPDSVNPKLANPTAANPPLQRTHHKNNHVDEKDNLIQKPAPQALPKSAQGRSFLEVYGFSWAVENYLDEEEAMRVAKLHRLDAGQAQRAAAEFAAAAFRGFRKSPGNAWFWLCKTQTDNGLAHTQSGDQNLQSWN